MVGRVGRQLVDVTRVAHGADARARQALEATEQLCWHDPLEQLLFAREVFVQVADRRAGSLGHVGHRGRWVAELCESAPGGGHEGFLDFGLSHLDHRKENHTFSFVFGKLRGFRDTSGGLLATAGRGAAAIFLPPGAG